MEETKVSYVNMISSMMFGFGDNQNPNEETVRLIEIVLSKQLRDALHEASKNADRRDMKTIQVDDIIFLLRHDRHKMQRLLRYMDFKYTAVSTVDYKSDNYSENSNAKRKKFETFKAIVEKIDETGELIDTDEFDNIKNERAIRAERISLALDGEKYKEYAKARQISFSNKNFTNSKVFRQWLDPLQELNISTQAIEILELLAYGIIGHIVDMSIIVRQNSRRISGDPLQMLSGSYYNCSMFNVPHISNNQASLNQTPITVREVREVIRRCYSPQVGYMNFSNKSILGKRKLMY